MIPLAAPNLTGKEQEYVKDAIMRNHVGPKGFYVDLFEEMVAKAAGRKWAIATITGSAALTASFMSLGFYDKTFRVGACAYPAAANALLNLGNEVELVGGGENHDFAKFAHPDGKWPTVWDRAPALGTWICRGGTLDCYSFAANKTVTCGQGGAICGDDWDLYALLVDLTHNRWGRYNFYMADINAAIGCAQMERLEEFRTRKREIWDRYAEHLPMVERGESRWMATTSLKIPEQESFEIRKEPFGTSLPCGTELSKGEQDIVLKACQPFLT
jgi:dTDP-4-amino-4,6-dideoxygalactose transaminase